MTINRTFKIVLNVESITTGNTYTILPGYQYVVLKYGGSGGGYYQALWLGSLAYAA